MTLVRDSSRSVTSVEDLERTVDVAGARRRAAARAAGRSGRTMRQTRPASSAASTTGCAGRVELGADEQAAHRARRRRRGSAREARRAAARRSRARCCEQLVVDRVAHRERGRARRRGCRRTSSRGRRAANAPAASSATSRQPIGRPFASPLASVTSCGRTPSCSKAKNVPVRPIAGLHLVEGEQRAELVGERGRGRRNCRLERNDAAFAEHRLEQDEADVVATPRPRSESMSFGCAKRAPGRSGSNAARFAG